MALKEIDGFHKKLALLDVRCPECVFEAPTDDFEGGCLAGYAYYRQSDYFSDAVVCSSRRIAMGVIHILRQYDTPFFSDVAVSVTDNLILWQAHILLSLPL